MFRKIIVKQINIMIEKIKMIYQPKGFEYFSNNNESEKDTFNFASSFKEILTNYYERK